MLTLNVLKKHKKAKIAIYFSGCIVSSYILKFLLKETNHLITVFFDQNKQKNDKENYLNEFESSLNIFSYLQKTYRDFNYTEIKLKTISNEYNIISNNNLEEKLKFIYNDIDSFDIFVLSQDKDFFSHKIQSFDLFSIFSHKEKSPIKRHIHSK